MRVDFPYTYTTKYANSKKGLSERKLAGTLAFDVEEARPEDVQVLVTWTMLSGFLQGVPGSCIRWRRNKYITLSHVDPTSPVVRSDLPVGKTLERGILIGSLVCTMTSAISSMESRICIVI
jgi:hypothetical protein